MFLFSLVNLFLDPYVNTFKNRYSTTRRFNFISISSLGWIPRVVRCHSLEEHFNTYEKASELIDGGNMGCCYSDNEYNDETGEYEKIEPRATYYGGDEEAPILSKNFDEFTRIDCWQEYAYVFVKDRWVGYSVRHKWNDDYSKMTDCIVEEVQIPKKETVE